MPHARAEAVDLWEEALGVAGRGLTIRRPMQECPLESGAHVSFELEGHSLQHLSPSDSLPEAVELSVECLLPGESCEVSVSHKGLRPDLRLLRVWRHLPDSKPATLEDAKRSFREGRFASAALKLKKLQPLDQDLEEVLRLLCICQCRLGLPASETADQLVSRYRKARHLELRARIQLQTRPHQALKDMEEAMRLDPKSDQRLLVRAKQQMKRQRRSQRWFDGHEVEQRSLAANSLELCQQCNRASPECEMGEPGSKMEGRRLCKECWGCWRRIRRYQTLELERQVERATFSDYSTATDDVASLDDVPQPWDSRHPMWSRENPARPDWQADAGTRLLRRSYTRNVPVGSQ